MSLIGMVTTFPDSRCMPSVNCAVAGTVESCMERMIPGSEIHPGIASYVSRFSNSDNVVSGPGRCTEEFRETVKQRPFGVTMGLMESMHCRFLPN